MRRVALVLVTLVVVATTSSLAGAETKPALRAIDRAPLVVRGTGFESLERVVLTARMVNGVRLIRRPTASRTGVFTARFGVPFGGCDGIRSVTAVGAKGSDALLRTPIITRDCPPPPAD